MHKFLIFLNQLWRIIITGFAFMIFGIGALILSLLIFPLHGLLSKSEKKRHAFSQKSIQFTFHCFIQFLQFSRVLHHEFIGFESLNRDKNIIIVANHPTLLDYVFLASKIDYCHCIVKAGLLNNFFLKGIIRASGYIPNDKDPDLFLENCQKMLKPNDKLMIFPEGTRSTPGAPFHLQRGAANIALRVLRDIQIVTISLDQSLLTKDLKWYEIPPKKPHFIIKVEQKIAIKKYIDSPESLNIQARRLTQEISKYFEKIPKPFMEKE